MNPEVEARWLEDQVFGARRYWEKRDRTELYVPKNARHGAKVTVHNLSGEPVTLWTDNGPHVIGAGGSVTLAKRPSRRDLLTLCK